MTQPAPAQPPRIAPWRNPEVRAVAFQVIAVVLVAAAAWFLVSNTIHNLETRGIRTGYGFLGREAGFAIGETVIEYHPADTYGRAFLAGVMNTLVVAVLGIILATVFGTLIGIGRLSHNWLVARICSLYVELTRNIPLLLQLAFWYSLITFALPSSRDALRPLPGFALSKSGLNYPVPLANPAHAWMGWALLVGVVLAVVYRRWAKRRQDETGVPPALFWPPAALIVGLPLLAWLAGGAPIGFDVPQWQRFRFAGGGIVSPEFLALLTGLVVYTTSFIAEIVRAGILAVPWGQTEAAMAIGLHRGKALRLVVLPQAMRVIIPPVTSQYLNLTKNSSLAVAVGYPDLVSVTNTTLNQTGQAIECISIMMAIYLTISLSISLVMNIYNKRMALKER